MKKNTNSDSVSNLASSKAKYGTLFVVSLIACILVLWRYGGGSKTSQPPPDTAELTQRRSMRVLIAGRTFELEVSESLAQIEQGLSGRPSVSWDGMVFVLPQRTRPGFWMKDMLIPLDFVWVDQDSVVSLHEDVRPPQPGTPEEELEVIMPTQPVTHVLEFPAGTIQRNSIMIGDRVEFEKSKKD